LLGDISQYCVIVQISVLYDIDVYENMYPVVTLKFCCYIASQ